MKNSTAMRKLLNLALPTSFDLEEESSTQIKEQNIDHNKIKLRCGEVLNQYKIGEELGRGGMGIVYKAIDTRLNREVAIKTIIQECNDRHTKKFIQEARAIAQLNHSNIVQIYEVCEHPVCFFAMELIEGLSLDSFIQQHSKKLKNNEYFEKVVRIFIAIASGLQFAHSKNIIHRDIKPENIMLDKNLHPKIMDFGLAKLEESGVTATKDFAGTPMYMSPEQAKSLQVNKFSDIYSLGATLYESLSARTVFQGDTVFNVVFQIIHNEPVRLRVLNSKIPQELEAICFKCLEKKSHRRYSSMKILSHDLENYLAGKPVIAKPIGRSRMLWKWVRRNKILSLLIVMFIFYAWGVVQQGIALREKDKALREKDKALREKNDAINKEKEALREKDKALREKNDAIDKEKEAIHKEDIAIRKKNAAYLKTNLHFANIYAKQKEISSARKYLNDARSSYQKIGFQNAERNLEFRWLKKKIKSYDLKNKIIDSRNIIKFKDKFLLITNIGKILTYKWDKQLRRKHALSTQLPISCVSLSPNYKKLAVLSMNLGTTRRYISIYNTSTMKQIAVWEIDKGKKNRNRDGICCFYSNEILLIGGEKGFRIWKIKNLQIEKTMENSFAKFYANSTINKVSSFSINSKTSKVFFTYGGRFYIYDFPNKKIEHFITIPDEEIIICKYNKFTKDIIIGTRKGKLYLIDSNYKVTYLFRHKSFVTKISYNQKYIFTSSISGEIFVWTHNGKLKHKIYSEESSLRDFILYKKKLIAINKEVIYSYKWDIKQNPFVIEENTQSEYVTVQRKTLSTPTSYGQLLLYNLDNKKRKEVVGFKKFIYSFVAPNSNKLMYINKVRSVFWDGKLLAKNSKKYPFFKSHPIGGVYHKQQNLLYLYSEGGHILVWDLEKEKIVKQLRFELRELKNICVLKAALSPDFRYLCFVFRGSFGNKKYIYLVDLITGIHQKVEMRYSSENIHVQFAVINATLSLILSFENEIQIWDFNKLRQKEYSYITLEYHSDYINCFALAQNNKRLIAIDKKGRMMIWYLGTKLPDDLEESNRLGPNRLLLEIETKLNIKDCVYLPTSKKLITVGSKILMWDFR
ncbi:protein kinase [Candidatus Uabimicrobium sp. HlEnr_7]|uniref:serine/threonine-protein kinase n=1 Tax=Candidatus Uabimicrobium helgolandensis TaxID=3095367 RepID=UPI00355768F2